MVCFACKTWLLTDHRPKRLPNSLPTPLRLPSPPSFHPTGQTETPPVNCMRLQARVMMILFRLLRFSSISLLRRPKRGTRRDCTRRLEPGRFQTSLVFLLRTRRLRIPRSMSGPTSSVWRSAWPRSLNTCSPRTCSQ